jgi:hypothetical protein
LDRIEHNVYGAVEYYCKLNARCVGVGNIENKQRCVRTGLFVREFQAAIYTASQKGTREEIENWAASTQTCVGYDTKGFIYNGNGAYSVLNPVQEEQRE